MKVLIIGSGGRELGQRLAEELKIPYYDQEIVKEIANRTLVPEAYVQQVLEQRKIVAFPIHIARSFQLATDQQIATNPGIEESAAIFSQQSKIILEMAEKSDCVIVGRCADYILRDYNPYRIFVYADMDCRVKRCREYAPENENLSDKELEKEITMIDKNRASYYNFHTGQKWGEQLNYDLCVNTSKTSIKEIVPVLAKIF